MTDDLTIIVCSHCVKLHPPTTTGDWLSRRLQEIVIPNGSLWRCPLCKEVVYQVFNHGTLDFGIGADPHSTPDTHREDIAATFETFEPAANPPE